MAAGIKRADLRWWWSLNARRWLRNRIHIYIYILRSGFSIQKQCLWCVVLLPKGDCETVKMMEAIAKPGARRAWHSTLIKLEKKTICQGSSGLSHISIVHSMMFDQLSILYNCLRINTHCICSTL